MSAAGSLDERMDDLLGDERSEHECPIFLEMSADTAHVVIEGLRWALYGGAQPPDGRRALLIVLDSLTTAVAS